MDKETILFDQYQRYQTLAQLVNYHRQNNPDAKFSILELGSNEHKDLRLFLNKDTILFSDINLTEKMQNDPEFAQLDGTDLPFENASFDFVVAADVFEHVPQEKRDSFITEAYRVARKGVILSFPYASAVIRNAEEYVSAYYKDKFCEDFIWLKEHSDNNLPDIDKLNEYFHKEGISYFSLFHGNLETWKQLYSDLFDAISAPETLELRAKIDRFYNQKVYRGDVTGDCYRVFYVLTHEDATGWKQYSEHLWTRDNGEQLEFLEMLMETHRSAKKLLSKKDREITKIRSEIATMEASRSWRITAPLRKMTTKLRSNRYMGLILKGIKSLKNNGFRVTWAKTINKLRFAGAYKNALKRPLYTDEELEAQRKEKFPGDITFSILVPLYNTPEKFLREMIQSVLNQTYANWELCLADGSDVQHENVGRICQEYAREDERVRYQKLEKNMGISGNTNACIDMATGDYITLFDHDDILHPAALYEVLKVICEKDADFIYTDEVTFRDTIKKCFNPHFKPDFAPDTLRANNYICHLTTVKKSLLDSVGKFRPECDGSQDFDMMLRLTEEAKRIVHIPKILYYWRAHQGSVADSIGAKPYVIEAAKRAIGDHLERVGLKGEALDSVVPSMYRMKYEIEGESLISILIPNYEHKAELIACLDSIYTLTTYKNFEVIIIENNSKSRDLFAYYKLAQEKWNNLKVVTWEGKFNYSAINNFGAKFASGEHILLLNNDTEVISPDWLQEMLMYSQREDVGAVGAKLYYPDNTIQHAGVGIGLMGLAAHFHRNSDRYSPGYMGRLIYAQNLSAVTAACMMISRKAWDKVNGLDESFEVAFNDVDLCMRIRQAGYLIVWTPFAELYHYESKSRGLDDVPEKRKRFEGEVERFRKRWSKELKAGDPYFNPNFRLDREDFSLN